jgi:hypothetical protein
MRKIIFFLIFFCLFGISAGAQDWQTEKSTHFIVYYKNAPSEFIRRLIDKSEDYYNKIASDLGYRRYDFWLWDERAKIYIYDNAADYQKGTGQPAWSGGAAQVKTKTITTFAGSEGFFETVLPHEMGHIIFREFVGPDNRAIPLWLEEGAASYQEKNKYAQAKAFLKRAKKNGTFMPLEKLSGFNLQAADDPAAQLFYVEAYSIVDFLIKEYGSDNFMLFCQNLRDKKNLEKAFVSSYPFNSLSELDAAWQKYLERL